MFNFLAFCLKGDTYLWKFLEISGNFEFGRVFWPSPVLDGNYTFGHYATKLCDEKLGCSVRSVRT